MVSDTGLYLGKGNEQTSRKNPLAEITLVQFLAEYGLVQGLQLGQGELERREFKGYRLVAELGL